MFKKMKIKGIQDNKIYNFVFCIRSIRFEIL